MERRITPEKTAEHSDFRQPVGLLNCKKIDVVAATSHTQLSITHIESADTDFFS